MTCTAAFPSTRVHLEKESQAPRWKNTGTECRMSLRADAICSRSNLFEDHNEITFLHGLCRCAASRGLSVPTHQPSRPEFAPAVVWIACP